MDKKRRPGKYDDLIPFAIGIPLAAPIVYLIFKCDGKYNCIDYRVALFAAPLILFLGAIFFIIISLKVFQNAGATNKWQTTTAEVERTLFAVASNGSNMICYKYNVDGQVYTAHTFDELISLDDPLIFIPVLNQLLLNQRIGWMERRLAEKYPVGSSFKVYYDPANPESVALKKGWSLRRCASIFVTTWLALLFLYWTFKTALLCLPR